MDGRGVETLPTGPRFPWRRFLVGAGTLGAGAAGAMLLLAGILALFVRLSWPHTEPPGTPEFGINFSCNYAEYLLLEDPSTEKGFVADDRPGRTQWCAETLGELLSGLGAKHVRLSVEWSQVEPGPGEFDWALMDALLAEAKRHGAKVLLTVGMKAQRHPEYYIPEWVLKGATLSHGDEVSLDPYVSERALSMIGAAVAHFSSSDAIDAWGADNEPYVPSLRASNWSLSRGFVQAEVDAIRRNDPRGRPVSINHGQHFVFDRRWQHALADADVLAQSLYPWRNYRIPGRTLVVPILEIGPLAPNYNYQARLAREQGRDFWITEMQAEPWVDGDIRLVSPERPSANLTEANFRKNIEYARRVGASRVYLWGAEWWLFQRLRYGDETWWNLGREAFSPPAGAAAAGAAPAEPFAPPRLLVSLRAAAAEGRARDDPVDTRGKAVDLREQFPAINRHRNVGHRPGAEVTVPFRVARNGGQHDHEGAPGSEPLATFGLALRRGGDDDLRPKCRIVHAIVRWLERLRSFEPRCERPLKRTV